MYTYHVSEYLPTSQGIRCADNTDKAVYAVIRRNVIEGYFNSGMIADAAATYHADPIVVAMLYGRWEHLIQNQYHDQWRKITGWHWASVASVVLGDAERMPYVEESLYCAIETVWQASGYNYTFSGIAACSQDAWDTFAATWEAGFDQEGADYAQAVEDEVSRLEEVRHE